MRYAWRDAGGWHNTTVDKRIMSGGVGWGTSLAIDPMGIPHISYIANEGQFLPQDVWYAHWDPIALSWATEFVASADYSPTSDLDQTSIALNSSGDVGVAFMDVETGALKYAQHTTSGWDVQQVDTPGFATGASISTSSLKIDSLDRPHIAYLNYSSLALRYAVREGTLWRSETVDPATGYAAPSLAIDSQDRPRIAYSTYSTGELQALIYSAWTGSRWDSTVVPGTKLVESPSLALDAADNPHISYSWHSAFYLMYAFWSGTAWQLQLVDSNPSAFYTSLALDHSGTAHIAYYHHLPAPDLQYARGVPSIELPELAISPADISFEPNGPVAAGTPVAVSVAVHNLGDADAAQVVVRFFDGPPPGAPRIGTDQVIASILRNGGTGTGSVVWQAGSPGVHEICVAADPDDLIEETDETNNVACTSIEILFSVQLTPGHRLMSFPLGIADEGIENVLSSIAGCYDYVRWYDPLDPSDHWKSYAPGRDYNDLARLDNTMGFWIDITATCRFTPSGTRPVSTTIDLHQGWNMVGFPSFNTIFTVADLKADIGLAGIVVEGYDPIAAPYYLQRLDDGQMMMTGEGYWVYVPSDATWIVND